MKFDELTFAGPYRVAQLRYVTDDGGYWRGCRSPGDDVSDLPDDARKEIEAEWAPEVIAAYVEATKEVPVEPEPPARDLAAELDALKVENDNLKARVAAVETRRTSR